MAGLLIGAICIPPAHGITRRGTLYLWMVRFAALSILITMHIVLSNRFFDRDYHVRKHYHYVYQYIILIGTSSIVLCVGTFHACHLMAPVAWIRHNVNWIRGSRHTLGTIPLQMLQRSIFERVVILEIQHHIKEFSAHPTTLQLDTLFHP